jgi:hypothetical protein
VFILRVFLLLVVLLSCGNATALELSVFNDAAVNDSVFGVPYYGLKGNGLSSGSAAGATMPNSDTYEHYFLTAPMTVYVEYQTYSTPTNAANLVAKTDDTSPNMSWKIRFNSNGNLAWQVYAGATPTLYAVNSDAGPWANGVVRKVVGELDEDGTLAMYINNVQQAGTSESGVTTLWSSTTPWYGVKVLTRSDGYDGSSAIVYHVAIWNRVLTSDEKTQMQNLKDKIIPSGSLRTGLRAEWRFDEGGFPIKNYGSYGTGINMSSSNGPTWTVLNN